MKIIRIKFVGGAEKFSIAAGVLNAKIFHFADTGGGEVHGATSVRANVIRPRLLVLAWTQRRPIMVTARWTRY